MLLVLRGKYDMNSYDIKAKNRLRLPVFNNEGIYDK